MRTGRPRKAHVQTHRPSIALVPTVARIINAVPEPPDGLGAALEQRWRAFWASEAAQLVNWEYESAAFSRLYRLYQRELRLEALAEDKEIVEGSQEQDVLNPALRHLAVIQHQILELEQQFGLTRRSRVGLGVQMSGLRKSLDDLNREANERAYGKPKVAKKA